MSQSNDARSPRRFQFSLVMLLALTGWAAFVCLALKTPTPPWAAAVFLLTMLAALAGGLGILYRTGRARVFAVGFFAGCLSYAACLFITEKQFGGQFSNENEMPTTQFADWLFRRLHPNSAGGFGGTGGMGGMGGGMGSGGMGGGGFFSVDSSLSDDQGAAGDPYGAGSSNASGIGSDSSVSGGGMGPMAGPGMAGGTVPAPVAIPVYYDIKHFMVIVHSALAMLMGLAGGIIAQLFYAAKRETVVERKLARRNSALSWCYPR